MEDRGFSFVDFLVALLLSTSISLALLKQQWQIHRWYNQIHHDMRYRLQKANQHEQGFSLIECVLSLSMTLALLFFLMQQTVQMKLKTDELAQTMRQMIRAHRVIDLLREKGHQAGFTPCLPLPYLKNFDHRNHQPLQAITFEDQPVFNLVYHHMSTQFVSIKPTFKSNQFILLEKKSVPVNKTMLIADCQHAEVVDHYELRSHIIYFFNLRYIYHSPVFLGEWISEQFQMISNRHETSTLIYRYQDHTEELTHDFKTIYGSHQKHALNLHLVTQNDTYSLLIRLFHA